MDLLALKAEEYDKLPGLLLGLDGWILRSIPGPQRKSFLEGYLKILRVTFHPDRYQDEAAKRSRQNYLQAVAEAVEFMSRDEFSFEMASDAVPTKRNPFVALQSAISVRDDVIATLNREKTEISTGNARDEQELKNLRWRYAQMEEHLKAVVRRTVYTQRIVAELVKAYPVPICSAGHQVSGYFIDVDRLGVDARDENDTGLGSKLNYYSDEDRYCGNSDWIKKKLWLQDANKYNAGGAKLNFKKLTAVGRKHSIYAATSIEHLCEFLREYRLGSTASPTWLSDALAYFLNAPGENDVDSYVSWTNKVQASMLSFYVPGMMLLLREKGDDGQVKPQLRLFLVRRSDYSASPDPALVKELRGEVSMLNRSLHERDKKYVKMGYKLRGQYSSKLQKWKREIGGRDRELSFFKTWFKDHKMAVPVMPADWSFRGRKKKSVVNEQPDHK